MSLKIRVRINDDWIWIWLGNDRTESGKTEAKFNGDWEAPRTNVATLAPPWWWQGWKWSRANLTPNTGSSDLTPNTSKCTEIMTAEAGLHNDEAVNFDGPDVVGWFSASACKRRLYADKSIYWNWEISWVTVFPCYDQCLNCIMQEVGLAEQSWKNLNRHSKIPNELLRESHEMPNELCSKFEEHSVAPVVGAKLRGAWSLNRVTQLLTMWTDSSENS